MNIIEKAASLIEAGKKRLDYAGGALCFVAVTNRGFTHGYGLGMCEQDVSGYWPLTGRLDAPEAPAPESWQAAVELQTILNEAIGLTEKDAYAIIVTTMRSRGAGISEKQRRERNKKRAASAKKGRS
mgnify:CR=1 FL=1